MLFSFIGFSSLTLRKLNVRQEENSSGSLSVLGGQAGVNWDIGLFRPILLKAAGQKQADGR